MNIEEVLERDRHRHPRPGRRRERPPAGPDLRLLLRRLPRALSSMSASWTGTVRARGHHPHDGHRRGVQRGGGAALCGPPPWSPPRPAARRGGGLYRRLHQERARRPGGRHRHLNGPPRRRASAGLPGGAAHGVLRHLPRRRRPLHRSAGRSGKAAAQRRLPLL